MAGLKYDKIVKYVIRAKCEGPLHIGSSIGGKEDVLIHPVDKSPFIQASSIAGVFRSYVEECMDTKAEILFGVSHLDNDKSTTEQQSRLRFMDGIFDLSSVKMELRPHVKIDRKTGSVSSSKFSGQKFNMEYVGEGAKFTTAFYLYVDTKETQFLEEAVKEMLGAMKGGLLQFGAKKSSGAGKIIPISVKEKSFLMSKEQDRKEWFEEESLIDTAYEEVIHKLPEVTDQKNKYTVVIKGKTEGAILVKGLSVSEFGEGAPDSENIRNANGEYIVPGSSFRGSIRSQMEKISTYLKKGFLIDDSFGKAGENDEEGYAGNLIFEDTVIGNQKENDAVDLRHRIHIDKFTGGVFQQGLFAEKNAFGDMELEIHIADRNHPDATLGLLLFAVRDLACKVMTLGSGFATGKGFMDISEIIVSSHNKKAKIIYQENVQIEDDANMIQNAMAALKEVSQ